MILHSLIYFTHSRTGLAQSVEHLAYLITHCEWPHDSSWFRVPPMAAYRYVEEDTLAAKLGTKRSAGVTQEVNLREPVTCMPLPSVKY